MCSLRCIISSLPKTACSPACGRPGCNGGRRPHRPYRPNRRYRSSPMNRHLRILLLPSLCTLLPMTALARDWQVDYAKSSLTFKDTYQNGPFEGKFKKFEAVIKLDDADVSKDSFDVKVDIASLDRGSSE